MLRVVLSLDDNVCTMYDIMNVSWRLSLSQVSQKAKQRFINVHCQSGFEGQCLRVVARGVRGVAVFVGLVISGQTPGCAQTKSVDSTLVLLHTNFVFSI